MPWHSRSRRRARSRLGAFALVLLLVLLAWMGGCSNLSGLTGGDDDAPPVTSDAGTTDSARQQESSSLGDVAATDVIETDSASPLACDLSKPFGKAEIFPTINSPSDDWAPRATTDGLTLYFASARQQAIGPASIFTATRSSTTSDFADAVLVGGMNLASTTIVHPTITGDGNTMYVQSDGPSQLGKNDIYTTSRVGTKFGPLTSVENVNTIAAELTPFISKDGQTLYFSTDRAGGPLALYAATKGSAGTFGQPQPMTELQGQPPLRAEFPVVSDDALTIYFARADTTLAFSIWVARRKTAKEMFGDLIQVSELDTPSYEAPSWLSPDGCTLYFISNRPSPIGVGGKLDMYRATRGK